MELLKLCFFFVIILINRISGENASEEENSSGRYTIEGKVYPLEIIQSLNWQANTKIHINGGEFIGFIAEDGVFLIHNVPSGSYILDVLHPEFTYEPVRVEINSKGKFRARKVNHIQTAQIIQVAYPLRLKPIGITKYFQLREQWRVTDFLFNPMILMMVLPLLLIMVLPKMMNDPETKKELEQIGSMTKGYQMPEVSDMVTNFFAGAPQPNQPSNNKKVAKTKKRQ